MIRVNAELNKSNASQLIDRLKSFSQALVATEVDLFNSRVNRIKNVIEEIDARIEMAYENKNILISEEKGIKDLRDLINDELFSGSSLQVKKYTENVRTILLKNLFLATFLKIID